jgi:hypothetical protein
MCENAPVPMKLVHLGQRIDNGFAEPFRQTTGHHQPIAATRFFESGQFENGVDRFIDGRFDEAARVDHNNDGLGRIPGQRPAGLAKLSGHVFTVHLIAGTPQAFYVCMHDIQQVFHILGRWQKIIEILN